MRRKKFRKASVGRSYFPSVSIKFHHFSTSSFLRAAETALVRRQSLVIHLYKYAEVTCVADVKYCVIKSAVSIFTKRHRCRVDGSGAGGVWGDSGMEVVGRREGTLAFKNELGNFITF